MSGPGLHDLIIAHVPTLEFSEGDMVPRIVIREFATTRAEMLATYGHSPFNGKLNYERRRMAYRGDKP